MMGNSSAGTPEPGMGQAPHAANSADNPRVRGNSSRPATARRRSRHHPLPKRARGPEALPRRRGCRLRITPACTGSRTGTARVSRWRGITPHCAGSRPERGISRPRPLDHPRVRGEQDHVRGLHTRSQGSPLRARGAEAVRSGQSGGPRITPACAGSRSTTAASARWPGDHPRVRGEQGVRFVPGFGPGGSPPRARGAGRAIPRRTHRVRITPACAGSRERPAPPNRRPRDHPRVRGEQGGGGGGRVRRVGSPPRARGAAERQGVPVRPEGITPACAGSRRRCSRTTARAWDHPRVRGEQM